MSSILPFVVVVLTVAVVARVAIDSAAQPATDADRVRRARREARRQAVAAAGVRAARRGRRVVLAGVVTLSRRWRAGWAAWSARRTTLREQRLRRRSARRATLREQRLRERSAPRARRRPPAGPTPDAPVPAARGTVTVAAPAQRVDAPPPDGPLTTALRVRPDVALAETAGEAVPPRGPPLTDRLRSIAVLLTLVAALGLGLAAGLSAAAAAIGAALDSFLS